MSELPADIINTIIEGDCLRVMPQLPTGWADAVLTDPPYNVGKPYGVHDDSMDEKCYLLWLKACFEEAARILKPSGPLVWFWPPFRVGAGQVPMVLPDGFHLHHTGAWFKQEFAGDLWKGNHPAYCWDVILWATRATAEYHGPRGGHAGRDMLFIGNSPRHDKCGWHPCPKPSAIVCDVLAWITEEKQIVLDPFAGAGTTGVACARLNRIACGIEKNPEYVKRARRRVREAQHTLFAGAKR